MQYYSRHSKWLKTPRLIRMIIFPMILHGHTHILSNSEAGEILQKEKTLQNTFSLVRTLMYCTRESPKLIRSTASFVLRHSLFYDWLKCHVLHGEAVWFPGPLYVSLLAVMEAAPQTHLRENSNMPYLSASFLPLFDRVSMPALKNKNQNMPLSQDLYTAF